MNGQQQRQIQVKVTDEVLKGSYANMMAVSHTKEEFFLDFMAVYPAQGQGMVNARIILTPGHTKRVLLALQDNIKKYEQRFGKIEKAETPEPEIGFRGE